MHFDLTRRREESCYILQMKDKTYLILEAAYAVHSELGPGLLESVYEKALKIELESRGFQVESQKRVPIMYRGMDLNTDERDALRLDLLVDGEILIELKSVEEFSKLHFKQVRTYLKLLDLHVGLLLNFNVASLREGIARVERDTFPPSSLSQ